MTSPIWIMDGGLGTTLEDRYGVRFSSSSTPLWSSHLLVSDPDTLLSCQREFSHAGADVLLTATYQVSSEGFWKTKTLKYPEGIPAEKIPYYLLEAIEIAEAAKSERGRLALSLGPYGATTTPSTEYSGTYDGEHDSVPTLTHWHKGRLQLFASPTDLLQRVDFIAFETLPRVDEVHAVRKVSSGHRFWISVLYPNGETMPDGTTPEQAIRAMLLPEEGAEIPWGIGINCTPIQSISSLVVQYQEAVFQMVEAGEVKEWPSLVLYPDGAKGRKYDPVAQRWNNPEKQMEVSCSLELPC